MLVSLLSRKILRELSTNSRITITELSQKIGISRPIIKKHVDSIEKEFGIKYTLELDYRALGLNNIQLLYVRFNKKPDAEVLKRIVNKSPLVQLAVATKGDFDMVIFSAGSNAKEQGRWEFGLQLELSNYGVRVNSSTVDIIHLGFIPLNKELIALADIDETYRKIILELNENSRSTIKTLATRLKMNEDMLSYYINKLIKQRIIRKFTAIVTKPVMKSNLLFFSTYTFSSGMIDRIKTKRRVYFKKEDDIPITSEYQMIASISGGEQDFVWGLYESEKEAVENGIELHKSIFKKDTPVIKFGFIKETIKGSMPIRSVDIKQDYEATDWSAPEF